MTLSTAFLGQSDEPDTKHILNSSLPIERNVSRYKDSEVKVLQRRAIKDRETTLLSAGKLAFYELTKLKIYRTQTMKIRILF